jgi:hypothetical protein
MNKNNFNTYENYMLYKSVISKIDRHLILKCENANQFHAMINEEVFNGSKGSDAVNELAILFLEACEWNSLYSNSFNIAYLNE